MSYSSLRDNYIANLLNDDVSDEDDSELSLCHLAPETTTNSRLCTPVKNPDCIPDYTDHDSSYVLTEISPMKSCSMVQNHSNAVKPVEEDRNICGNTSITDPNLPFAYQIDCESSPTSVNVPSNSSSYSNIITCNNEIVIEYLVSDMDSSPTADGNGQDLDVPFNNFRLHKNNNTVLHNVLSVDKEPTNIKPDGRGKSTPPTKVDRDIIKEHVESFNPVIAHYRREHAPLFAHYFMCIRLGSSIMLWDRVSQHLSELNCVPDETMRIPLYLVCTTFCSLGASDVETMRRIRFELLRSLSLTIFYPFLQQHQISDAACKRKVKLELNSTFASNQPFPP
ncbi:hypothetical protein J6590_004760 [Homalodisca vitripennis]|nr:hypothetical protein J6590_004760 [Homalodisca vitripennis]